MITDEDKTEIAKILEELAEIASATGADQHVQYHLAPEGCYAVVDHKEIIPLE